ncbi:short-chain dehydrogenase reductase sdr [Pyrenophora seminiperda CCB06]|uniref:Short-chain dehydrogenase reductase sdr n=1 Tax=Pyrenophora seminiperda CCB06 TaxID=1302712 RepID=A0A3M7MA16_9PLEO|nr:short-chain dehydrogenase reductase sdr [Pyrenophora seminiperda CCB06]
MTSHIPKIAMSNTTAPAETFAAGRYSKRKRTQVTYHMEEMDVSDAESEFETLKVKKRKAKTIAPPLRKALRKREIFPFMQLPAELRNMIYTYALTDGLGIYLIGITKDNRRNTQRVSAKPYMMTPLVPSLLAVNKQIYREGIDILYDNEFFFANGFALYAFMINLGPTGAKHIKKITLQAYLLWDASGVYNHCCFASLVLATNLTFFRIDYWRWRSVSPKRVARQLYRDAFPWLEAMGAAKGKLDAAVDVLQLDDRFLPQRWPQYQSQLPMSDIDEFKVELRKLLGAQQKKIMRKARVRKT